MIQRTLLATKLTLGEIGFNGMQFDSFSNTSLPNIAQGSVIEISGNIFECTVAETVDSTNAMATGPDGIYFTYVSSASFAGICSTTVPTFSDSKNGLYATLSGTSCRAYGMIVKASGLYTQKTIFTSRNTGITNAGLNLQNTANADKEIRFATDCALNWLETNNQFSLSSKRLITMAPMLHVRDEKAQNTGGGTFTSGAWRTRTLNTTKINEIVSASLASNQITLPPGTYYIEWSAPAYAAGYHQSRLQNITDGTTTIVGSSELIAGSMTTSSNGNGQFTIASQKVFELQHYCSVIGAFGYQCNFTTEVYASVKIWQIA